MIHEVNRFKPVDFFWMKKGFLNKKPFHYIYVLV